MRRAWESKLMPRAVNGQRVARAGIALLVLACGCGHHSVEAIAEHERRAVRSLAGTAQLVEESWRAGAVPRHFAEDALAGVSRSLDQRRRALAADTALGAAARRALTDSVMALDARVTALRESLARPRRRTPSSPGSG